MPLKRRLGNKMYIFWELCIDTSDFENEELMHKRP